MLIGWSPDLATAVGARVDEILSGFDPRTVTGPQMWLLMSAVGMRVAPFSALEMAAEGLENVLSRPFGSADDHVARLLTCCAAFRLGHRMSDPELRDEGLRRLWELSLDEPGTFMSRCIASAELATLVPEHVWVNVVSGEGEDPLVRAERAIWTGSVGAGSFPPDRSWRASLRAGPSRLQTPGRARSCHDDGVARGADEFVRLAPGGGIAPADVATPPRQ